MTREVETIEANTSIDGGAADLFRSEPIASSLSRWCEDGVFLGWWIAPSHQARKDVAAPSLDEDSLARIFPSWRLPEETCRTIATRLAVHHLERLPVVKIRPSRELLGLVARSDLVKPSLASVR